MLLGTALGDLLHGLPINSDHNYTGSFWGLLVPYGLYTGLTLTVLSLFLGATYLTLKTDGDLHERCARLSGRLGWLAAVVAFGWLTWSHVGLSVGFVPNPIDALALIAIVAAAWLAEARSQGWAFAAAAIAIGSIVGVDLLRPVPPGHGVEHQHRLQPHHRQLGQPLLHPDGHDRGRRHRLPRRARLPGLEPLGLPQTAHLPAHTANPVGPAARTRRPRVRDLEPGQA